MAFTEFYCNSATGANINAGDLTANGVVTSTNGAWSTVTNIFTATSGTPFSGVSVGDFASLYADGGTVSVYVARVTAIGGGGLTLTLSSTAKSGTAPTTSATAISCTTGGAWKGPNAAVNFPFGFVQATMTDAAGDTPRVNFKNNATYSITANVAQSAAGPVVWQGYTTTAGDLGLAVIDGGTSGASYTLLTVTGGFHDVDDFQFQNNGATGSSDGVACNSLTSVFRRCVVTAVRRHGMSVTWAVQCEAYLINQSATASAAGFTGNTAGALFDRCISHDNSASGSYGFQPNSNTTFLNCIADTNASHGFGTSGSAQAVKMTGCIAYNNGGSGLFHGGTATQVIENCLFVSNASYGINANGNAIAGVVQNCGFYNNTSGQTNGVSIQASGSVTLTGDPFTAASTGNFTLNNTASAGAACRGTGIGTFTETQASYTGTLGYPDIGAAQHQDAGGTANMLYRTGGG